MTPGPAPTVLPALHAARILHAWDRGDEMALRQELAISLAVPHRGGPSLVQEQSEVLNAVVTRLSCRPEPLEQALHRPAGRACIALLRHLASQA